MSKEIELFQHKIENPALIAATRTRIENAAIEEKKQANILRLNREAEDKFKRDGGDEQTRRAYVGDQAKINVENRVKETERIMADNAKLDQEHRRKIHNKILEALMANHFHTFDDKIICDEEIAKDIIKAIANGKIPHLVIQY